MNINSVNISGNLTRSPEMKDAGGTPLAKLRLACNERTKKGDEWVDSPMFFDVDVWGRMAEVCDEYLDKGSAVVISGRLKWREWENDEGQKRSAVSITANVVQFLGKREDGNGSKSTAPAEDDDIPF